MKHGLSDAVIESIRATLARFPQVERAVIYGSRAKGDYRAGSDIDLALYGGADLTLQVRHRIADALDDLPMPYTVDLALYADIRNPDLLDHLHHVGATLYEKAPAADLSHSGASAPQPPTR